MLPFLPVSELFERKCTAHNKKQNGQEKKGPTQSNY